MKRRCFWNPSDELFRHLSSSQEFLDRKHDWVVCFLYTVFLKVVITLPNVGDCEDKEGKNTIDGQLVPVVWPLHVDLILAQSGHCIGWASLGCEALELDELCYVDRNTQAGREQNKLHPAEGIVKRMQESSDKNKTECLLDATGWQLYS